MALFKTKNKSYLKANQKICDSIEFDSFL